MYKIIFILFVSINLLYAQPSDVFEIESIYCQGFSRTKRYMTYKINIYKKNNEWIINTIDGPLDRNHTVFIGIVPEKQIYSLYELLSNPDELIYEESYIDAPNCYLTIIYHKHNNMTLTGDFSDYKNVDFRIENDIVNSTIAGFSPHKNAPERKIEEIHSILFHMSKKYAIERKNSKPDIAHTDFNFDNYISSVIGYVELIKAISFFQDGYEISDVITLNNKKVWYPIFERNKSRKNLFEFSNYDTLIIENSQILIKSEKLKTPISPILHFGDYFVLSENERYLIFGQYASPLQNIYYRLDFETREILQLLTFPASVNDMQIDNNGKIFLQVNGEIYKWDIHN